jgi:glycosyltransferase involved in cell wall biosynthesis
VRSPRLPAEGARPQHKGRQPARAATSPPNSKPVILHLPSMLPDEEHPYWGNFFRAHIESAAAISEATIVYHAYALTGPSLLKRSGSAAAVTSSRDGVDTTTKCYRKRTGWQILALLDLFAWVRPRRNSISLIHAHGAIWAGVWAAFIGRVLKIPVVLSEHSSAFPQRRYPRLVRTIGVMALRNVDLLLPVTHNLGEYLHDLAPRTAQCVIPNCVETDLFTPCASDDSLPLRALFAGSFVEVKRVDVLLDAVAAVQPALDMTLRLAGGGPLLPEMKRLALERCARGSVEFIGILNRAEIRRELEHAHVAILSSAFESQPRILLEAMMTGRPVVAPRVGGIPELDITPHAGELFDAGSADDLARAITKVASRLGQFDPDTIAQRCRSKFSYDAVAKQLAAAYGRVWHP